MLGVMSTTLCCAMDDCGAPLFKRGLCESHHLAWKEGHLRGFEKRVGGPPADQCGCGKPAKCRGLCGNCYARAWKLTKAPREAPTPFFRGQKLHDFTGQLQGKVRVLRCCNPGQCAVDTRWACVCDCNPGVEFERTHKKLIDSRRLGSASTCGNCFAADAAGTIASQQFKAYRLGAVSRGLDFELTLDEFSKFIFSPCSYCGVKDKTKHGVDFTGIDRLHNHIGYTLGNCAACCCRCNAAKSAHTLDSWRGWIGRLASNFENFPTPK